MAYVLFRDAKRVSLRDEDLTACKVSRIFQVMSESLYLTDDSNRALFPDDHGIFPANQLSLANHYEVHGDAATAVGLSRNLSAWSEPHYSSGSSPTLGFGQRMSPVPSTSSAVQFRKQMTKTFQRAIQVVEPLGSSLLPVQTVYLKLCEADANVASVASKLQEVLDSEEAFVVTDSKGQELLDSSGTQGLEFWKTQTRKIYCMTSTNHSEWQKKRRSKQRRLSTSSASDCLEEQMDVIGELMDKTRQLRSEMDALLSANSGHLIVKVSRDNAQKLQDAFTCAICKDWMRTPVFATCCKTLMSCSRCAEVWFASHASCPKCRNPDGRTMSLSTTAGLQEALQVLSEMVPQI